METSTLNIAIVCGTALIGLFAALIAGMIIKFKPKKQSVLEQIFGTVPQKKEAQ